MTRLQELEAHLARLEGTAGQGGHPPHGPLDA